MDQDISLAQLGWSNYFQGQLSLDDWEKSQAARVMTQQRNALDVMTEQGAVDLAMHSAMPAMTVGDWLLLDEDGSFLRLLERKSLFSRKAAGSKVQEQLIAANVDTLFIVCSLNQDFNLSRIERYLALAHEAGAEPVIVLSKADCCDDVSDYLAQVQRLDSLLMVVAVNGHDSESVAALQPWCREGKTAALLGSSGAGKSTLVNTLLGTATQSVGGIRQDDSKGRHTTTGRSLHLMPEGGLLLDTPGMRELQLADTAHGVAATFAEITALAEHCRFSDCQHDSEPGCAVRAGLEEGLIDERRLSNYRKLLREQAQNAATLAEKRSRDRDVTRYHRTVQSEAKRDKRGDS
jgi:ribosome biogenesis GTPase